jgi:hypothetical protein
MRVRVLEILCTAALLTVVGALIFDLAWADDNNCSIQSFTANPDVTTVGQGVQISASVGNPTQRLRICLVKIVVWESKDGVWRNPTRPTDISIQIPAGGSASAHMAYVPYDATRYKAVAGLFSAPGSGNGGERLGEAECYFICK